MAEEETVKGFFSSGRRKPALKEGHSRLQSGRHGLNPGAVCMLSLLHTESGLQIVMQGGVTVCN